MQEAKRKRTVADYPHLVSEWHPYKNEGKRPADYTYGSKKSVWWLCPEGHEYEALICNRTGRNSGCRKCADQAPKPWSKKITVNGIEFDTVTAASEHFDISAQTLRRYLTEQKYEVIDLPDAYQTDPRFKKNKLYETGSLEYLRQIAESKGLVNLEDWYGTKREGFLPTQFSKFINQNWHGDWVIFLEELYQGSAVQFWRLERIPLSIWNDKKRVNQYLDWLGNQLQFYTIDDWYKLRTKDLIKNFGSGLYEKYRNIFDILRIRFPDEEILIWKISKVPTGTWSDKAVHLAYIHYLQKELKIVEKNDWYKITNQEFKHYGGGSILKQYDTLVDCLRENLPDLNLLPWKFLRSGRKFWENSDNRRWFVEWMATQLEINEPNEYYSVSERHFVEYGGITALIYHDTSPAKCIMDLMPELNLDFAEFDKASKGQLNLYRYLKKNYPSVQIKYNYKHPVLKFQESGRKVEIDLFFEKINIGIEVQGAQHYREAWGGQDELTNIKNRDKEKRVLFKKSGIKVFEIRQTKMPMSWDKLEIYLYRNFSELIERLREEENSR
ncbi:zinc-ribbon domain-containing protein [Alphaproteobacteria bacterium]|nr:zinc-ribbon domain-containing protein [Alphaproteobacteria bacterium]